ncbi:hypothetical protein GGI15_000842 [Coemansia interrupta]|uniref:Fungal-type protein kinase domain-containing protein n=1 Tax=Coemansia interrupta TaxID=1126814 RepID=A0A9W8LLZ4_9FUNG|nr:hypothetical protein GGI15_000842 [Coemansia interrupta]
MESTDLITYLGLESQYEQYDAKSAYICDGLLEKIPTFADGKYCIGDSEDNIKEGMLVKWFEQIYHHLKSLDTNEYLASPPNTRYIYENHETTSIHGSDAVLKLSWTPVERQPEGALYDILQHGKVENIPKIYRSGIIVGDFLGYRLEYILMEHCGEPVNALFAKHGQDANDDDYLYSCAGNVIQKVCACLLQAASAGVFHRDVSAGNITLRDGKVFLIDWGFGKVIPAVLDVNTKDIVNGTWNIDLDKITRSEDARDGVTGTVLFMGVRILMGLTSHSVFDDMESVFYVVLSVLSYIGSSKSEKNDSELRKANHWIQATSRIGCVADEANYLRHFGVSECSEGLRHILDALRTILFEQDGRFIGGILLSAKVDVRKEDKMAIRHLLGDEVYNRCFPESAEAPSNAEDSSASLKRKFATATITDTTSMKLPKVSKEQDDRENTDPNIFGS